MKDKKLENLGIFMFFLFTFATWSLFCHYIYLFEGVDFSNLSLLISIMYGLSIYGGLFLATLFTIIWYKLFYPESEEELKLNQEINKLKKKYKNRDVFRLKRKELEATNKLNDIKQRIKEYRSI